jgi:hypothetical protein
LEEAELHVLTSTDFHLKQNHVLTILKKPKVKTSTIYEKRNLKTKIMNKEQVLGIIRHALTFIGGIIIIKGMASEGMVGEAIGAVVTAVGAVWSVIKNK